MERKIARFLPEIYAVDNQDAALRHIIDALAKQIKECENNLIRISFSQYVDFASRDVWSRSPVEDLDRIGALYNIKRIIERVENDPEKDESLLAEEHRKLLERYRNRLKDMVQVFLGGLATVKTIIRTVGAVFGLKIIDIILPGMENTYENPVIKNDASTTTAILQRADRQEDPFRLDIIDNPWRERQEVISKQQLASPWILNQQGIYESDPQITISAGRDPEKAIGTFGKSSFGNTFFHFTVPISYPLLINNTNGQMILFNGIIPSERKLHISITTHNSHTQYRATITPDQDVSDQLFFGGGARFNRHAFGQNQFGLLVQNTQTADLPIGVFGTGIFGEHGFHFYYPSDVLDPFLTYGENEWEYANLKEPFHPGENFADLQAKIDYQNTIYPREINFQWQEQARAAFAVRIPSSIGFLARDQERNLFIETVNLVKAAGIEALFDFENVFYEKQDMHASLMATTLEQMPKAEEQNQEAQFFISGLLSRTHFGESYFG